MRAGGEEAAQQEAAQPCAVEQHFHSFIHSCKSSLPMRRGCHFKQREAKLSVEAMAAHEQRRKPQQMHAQLRHLGTGPLLRPTCVRRPTQATRVVKVSACERRDCCSLSLAKCSLMHGNIFNRSSHACFRYKCSTRFLAASPSLIRPLTCPRERKDAASSCVGSRLSRLLPMLEPLWASVCQFLHSSRTR